MTTNFLNMLAPPSPGQHNDGVTHAAFVKSLLKKTKPRSREEKLIITRYLIDLG